MLFPNVRIYLYIGAFVLWSLLVAVGVSRYKEAGFLAERLKQAEAIAAINLQNQDLALKLSKDFQEALNTYSKKQEALTKELRNELKAPVYSDCRTTDGVRDIYKRKLEGSR